MSMDLKSIIIFLRLKIIEKFDLLRLKQDGLVFCLFVCLFVFWGVGWLPFFFLLSFFLMDGGG